MSQFKILQALEDVIFEIMAWIMLLPKTLFQVIFAPTKAIKYVNEEWEKKLEDRFDEFLSPIFFWILVAVLPLTYTLLSGKEIQQDGILAVFSENKIFLGAIIASLLLFVYIAWIEVNNNRPLRKSALKRMTYIQCYITSPAVLIITLVFRFTSTVQSLQRYLLLSVIFVVFYETFVMKYELEESWGRAVWNAVLPLIITAAVIGSVIALIILL